MNDNEMIVVNGNEISLNQNVSQQLATIESTVKKMKEIEEEIKARILMEMESRGIYKIDTPDLTITYIAPSERDTFDSKAFKMDNPKMYHQYVKTSEVKSSVRIKVK